jgi:hypothetical protein
MSPSMFITMSCHYQNTWFNITSHHTHFYFQHIYISLYFRQRISANYTCISLTFHFSIFSMFFCWSTSIYSPFPCIVYINLAVLSQAGALLRVIYLLILLYMIYILDNGNFIA